VGLWAEIRRRKVVRAAVAYAIIAWLLVQVATAMEPALRLPEWFDTFIVATLIIGFPIACLLAWWFELTPGGVKLTADAAAVPPPALTAGSAAAPAILTARAASKKPSIAVLAFADMSPERDQEYFSDGLAEELLNQLAQLKDLRVIGRTSSFAFKGKNTDLRTIGETLGARHILEGSVRKAGDRLRVTAQLIDASDGSHVWSEAFDRQLADVFAIQDEIAGAVASALKLALGVGGDTTAEPPTADVEVYDLYLRARAQFHHGGPVALERASDMFHEVLARDPDFLIARSSLAETYTYVATMIPERSDEMIRALERVAAEARARAPEHWTTHFTSAVAHAMRKSWADAERAFTQAAEHAGSNRSEISQSRGWMLLAVGRAADVVDVMRESVRGDPLSSARSLQLQTALQQAGRREEAEVEYRRSADLAGASEPREHLALFRAWEAGDRELTRSRFDGFLRAQSLPLPVFAAERAVADDPDAVLALLRAAHDDPANQDPTRQLLIGLHAGHYGGVELALAALRRGFVDLRGSYMASLWYPHMAAVRRAPGFKDLVRDLGLVDYWRETGEWGDFCRPVGADDFECF
jgi:TolB-like protein